MLSLVPTPIGNKADMSFRSVETLKKVDLILAEDTRVSGRLLKHFDISTKMRSYHANNEHAILDGILDSLKEGMHIGLITDAGTPGISDPGFLLVRACIEAGIKVECLPGANAAIPALAVSGLPCDRFFFEGFLPQKKGRQTRLIWLASLPYTFVLYESPHRLLKCLKQLIEHCGGTRKACVAREISKMHEELNTDQLDQILAHYEAKNSIKGEIVIVVAGAD